MLAATARALVSRRGPTAAICSPLRSLSSSSSPNGDTEVLLLRDFISRRLTGYFSAPASSSPVGELSRALAEEEREKEEKGRSDRGEEGGPAPASSSIDFPSLSGRASYEHALSRLYRALSVSWLTPSELFSPHYGRAVARFVAEDAKARTKSSLKKDGDVGLRVVEVGAGRGTLAADFLGYLAEVEPALYKKTRYVSLEVSPSLARAQRDKVLLRSPSGSGGGGESSRFSAVVGDASDLGAWRRAAAEAALGEEDGGGDEGDGVGREDRHLYVLALEVLDNLPHDRVVREEEGSQELEAGEAGEAGEEEEEGRESRSGGGGWLQTHVEVEASPAGRPLRELLGPASDPLISLCLSASRRWQEQGSGSGGGGGSSGGSGGSSSAVARFFDSLFSFAGVGRVGGRGGGGPDPSSSSSSSSEEEEIVFLPTGAASMFSSIIEVAPDHTLLAADFDALPGVAVPGAGAPLVSSTRGGVARDYPSLYSSAPAGEAVDIFFPTNFDALSDLYVECARRKQKRKRRRRENGGDEEEGEEGEEQVSAAARHCKQSSFLSLAADTAAFSRGAVSTASGWSPMLDDWNNTAVLVARSREKKKQKGEGGEGEEGVE